MSGMQALNPLEVGCDGVRLIEASAGTGKTYTIATLYLRLLLERRRSVSEVLVVTFTEAATEELRDRIRGRMREALRLLQDGKGKDDNLRELLDRLEDRDAAIEYLTNELTRIDEAAIFTIHGFCQRMLQENAFESGAFFDTEFLTDEGELLAEVVEDFWRREFYPDPGLARLAHAAWKTPGGLLDEIRPYIAKRALLVHPRIEPEACSGDAYRKALARVREVWDAHAEAVQKLLAGHKGLSQNKATGYGGDRVAKICEEMTAFLAGPKYNFAAPKGLEWFTPAKLANCLLKKAEADGPPRHEFFEACAALLTICGIKKLELIGRAIEFSREQLAVRKQQRGVISFDDLLSSLSDALTGEGGDVLAARIAGRFPYALIDEFQDTDPEQYRIFSTIYQGRADCGLFMIGDPKQAIYSFRGADVFTYMQAKDDTDPASERFTLGTNWRSARTLVQAVNTLFDQCPAPFVYAGHIDFQAVEAAGKADESPLLIDGAPPVPLHAWFVGRRPENVDHRGQQIDLSKPIKKGWADTALSAACAEEIVDLLTRAQQGKVRIGERELEPRDIAVLVRDRFEAEHVQAALRGRGVASVYYSRDSVFAAPESEDLLRVMSAVAEPDEERTLRAALCTGLLGATAAELDALLQDELAWEAVHEEFDGYHRTWAQHGFMVMFRRLLHARGIPGRLLEREEGERALTNLLQLAELTQNASREHDGIENLLHWFAEQRAAPDGNNEDQQLRLESDADLVKIVTIHKSKGLEYPVVFLPFLWKAKPVTKKTGPVLFHEETEARELVLDLTRDEAHAALAEKERLAEDLRLAYVALTRAQYLCYFAWGQFKEVGHSALAWLLHARADSVPAEFAETVKGLKDEVLRERLEALAKEASGCLKVDDPPIATLRTYRAATEETGRLEAREPRRRLRQDWHVASFTGLTQDRFEPMERPDYGSAGEDAEQRARGDGPSIFQFPKGARAGSFMHLLFESIDFPRAEGEALAGVVASQLARHGYEPEWQPVIEQMVGHVLDTALGEEGLALRGVTRERRLIEMEFHYPIARLTAEALNAVLPGLGAGVETPRLRFNPVAGMMRGFIDLVFEHRGRFYLADYKSSYLGPRVEDYGREALRQAVAAHRYDLQYLIYTVALHRYLRHRIADYRYETHFGGVYYLFLRGMRPERGRETGVYFDRPEPALVERLDALFEGRGVVA